MHLVLRNVMMINKLELLHLFKKYGARLTKTNNSGNTCLHSYLFNVDDTNILEALISEFPDLSLKNGHNLSFLDIAKGSGNETVIAILESEIAFRKQNVGKCTKPAKRR